MSIRDYVYITHSHDDISIVYLIIYLKVCIHNFIIKKLTFNILSIPLM